jgi:exonuclease VII large subunit
VDRQLERGYTLTLTTGGALVRSAESLPVGSEIVTRFADGSARSRVESAEIRNDHVEDTDEETA